MPSVATPVPVPLRDPDRHRRCRDCGGPMSRNKIRCLACHYAWIAAHRIPRVWSSRPCSTVHIESQGSIQCFHNDPYAPYGYALYQQIARLDPLGAGETHDTVWAKIEEESRC